MNADDLIAICLYLMNKLQWNFIDLVMCYFFGGLTGWTGCLVIFRSMNIK